MSNANLVALQNAINTNTLSIAQQSLLSAALDQIIPVFPDVDQISRGVPDDDALTNTWFAPLFAIGSGVGGTMFPLLAATFIDPSNVTGNATDAGPGDLAAPLLTVGELNRRLVQAPLDAIAYTITFLSDELGGDVQIDTFGVRGRDFELDFVGTPTVLHTGTLTAGTIVMNPAAAAGGQSTILDDTVLGAGGWAPFVGKLLRVTAGPRAGQACWITHSNAGTTAVGSAPMLDAVLASGPQSGDAYEIVTGTVAQFGSLATTNASGFPLIQFADFDASAASGVINATGVGFIGFLRCFMNVTESGSEGTELDNCWAGDFIFADSLFVQGGAFMPRSPDGLGVVAMTLGDHALVGTVLIVSNAAVGVLSLGVSVGVQFQNCPGGAAMSVTEGLNVSLSSARVWGKNNAPGGAAVAVHASASLTIAVPTVTGPTADWVLGASGLEARAWDTVAGAYTAPIAARTWAALANTVIGGGFGNGAHNPNFDIHLMSGVV
jgi:hypothetical protein